MSAKKYEYVIVDIPQEREAAIIALDEWGSEGWRPAHEPTRNGNLGWRYLLIREYE